MRGIAIYFIGVITGLMISAATASVIYPALEAACTQGKLYGYEVQDAKGRVICHDPLTAIEFRGPTSYIYCE